MYLVKRLEVRGDRGGHYVRATQAVESTKVEHKQDSLRIKSYLSSTINGRCSFHPPGCDIKGNISLTTGEKIYHMPGDEFYDSTVINLRKGERWFCTEDEAIANGWRKSRK